MESPTKVCTGCGEEKELDDFPADRRKKDGRRPECRDCHNSKRRKPTTSTENQVLVQKKSHKYMKLVDKLLDDQKSEFYELGNLLDGRKTSEMNMSGDLKVAFSMANKRFHKLLKVYEKALDPPIDEFHLDHTDIIIPITDPRIFMDNFRSWAQLYFATDLKVTDVTTEIVHDSGTYLITFRGGKMTKVQFTEFLKSKKYVAPTYVYH